MSVCTELRDSTKVAPDNYIGQDGAFALAKMLEKNTKLQRLYLNGTTLEGRVILSPAGNQIGGEGAAVIAASIAKNQTLFEISLGSASPAHFVL